MARSFETVVVPEQSAAAGLAFLQEGERLQAERPSYCGNRLDAGVKVKFVELLCVGHTVPFRLAGEMLSFTIPRLEDYEVAAIIIG
jgi:hypothetical protein